MAAMDGNGKMTEFEKKYLKEAICEMIDEGRTYGHIDTMEVKDNTQLGGLLYNNFVRKEWEISIRLIKTNEYGG